MVSALFDFAPVVVRGGGDLASGVVFRLHKAGFPLVVTELEQPSLVRRTVSFGNAVYENVVIVEGVTARQIKDLVDIRTCWENDEVPVVVDANATIRHTVNPLILIDARMNKANDGTTIDDAPLVIALGPGYVAGMDCHVVIETMRGHTLGRVINNGTALPDTGTPGTIQGRTDSRVIRAPANGLVKANVSISDTVAEGDRIATVDSQPVIAPFAGVVRGLVHPSLPVTKGMKIGDLDPRLNPEQCFTISDKSLAIGGGVLEAILNSNTFRQTWLTQQHETSDRV